MLLLDFEKTYDRVNWTFLRQVMERMRFSNTWITQVMFVERERFGLYFIEWKTIYNN